MARVASKNGVNGSAKASNGEASQVGVVIQRPKIERILVPIRGITPLIVHAWSEKAKKMMLDKQMGLNVAAKPKKDPKEDYLGSLYWDESGEWTGVKSSAFKAALVGAARQVNGLTMTLLKRTVYICGQGRTREGESLIRIIGEHRMWEDMVRLESGVADIRFRAEYPEWEAVLQVEFNGSIYTETQIVNLISLAGAFEGVCEWRPSAPKSATGEYGRFEVKMG